MRTSPSHLSLTDQPLRQPAFQPGDQVRLRADPARRGVVTSVSLQPHGYDYAVFFDGSNTLYYHEDQLERVPQHEPATFLSHRQFLRDLLLLKLQAKFSDSLYSLHASRTLLRAYQFKPVLKFLKSAQQRILIADEVGLGKTIEAGLIYLELQARVAVRRVLVVCPSNLKQKWALEMRSRFDDEFTIYDSSQLRVFLEEYARDPGRARLKAICGLETLRRDEFRTRLEELQVSFDLVIIDEAHHMRNPATQSHDLGEILAKNADALVLLTATPLHTGNQDLFHLLQLIDPGEFQHLESFTAMIEPNRYVNQCARLAGQGRFRDALAQLRRVEHCRMGSRYQRNPYYRDVVHLLEGSTAPTPRQIVQVQRLLLELNSLAHIYTRTRKREVEDAAQRVAYTFPVQLTPVEKRFYDAVVDFVCWELNRFSLKDYRGFDISIFTIIQRERQAASCIPALRDRFKEALETWLLVSTPESSGGDLYALEDDADAGLLTRVQLSDAERACIAELLQVCQDLGNSDSKFDTFLHALKEILREDPEAKILVFSFFRDTLTYLYDRLRTLGFNVGLLHGGIPMHERPRIIEQFAEHDPSRPAIQILLSSEVGAEGLDFQFCGVMFNYDLPWNPMRVEQRIGRLDRFGQVHEKIRIYNLVLADTIEDRILRRLYERIKIFEASVGDLEEILGEEVRELSRDIFLGKLTPKQQEQRLEEALKRIERHRLDQEDFERERLALVGHDELFKQDVEAIQGSGRFISPSEVRALVESYLKEAFPRVRLIDNRDGSYALDPDPDLAAAMANFVRNKRLGKVGDDFVRRLESSSYRGAGAVVVPLTFDSEIARQRRLAEFITVRHPLALAAADYYQRRHQTGLPMARLVAPCEPEHAGDYAFFIFQLDVDALVHETQIVPILIHMQTGVHNENATRTFLAAIQHSQTDTRPDIPYDEQRFEELKQVSQRMISSICREREWETRARNDALIEMRKASLRQTYNYRIARAQEQSVRANDQRIARMKAAEARNLEAQLEDRLRALDAKKQVSVGYKLVAAGLARLQPEPSGGVRRG